MPRICMGVLSGEVELILVVKDEIKKTDIQFEEYVHTQTEVLEREVVVDSIKGNEILGWTALTPSGKFTSKATCAAPSRLFAWPASSLKAFFNQQPQIGYLFMERLVGVISKRFSNRTEKLIEGWLEAFAVDRV